jgi:hypothetical protein
MVDFDSFLRWAESRFDSVLIKGKEILINTPFESGDTNHHLSCSPSGGKFKRDDGVYHCWKTDRRGSLLNLIREIDGCSKREALEKLKHGGCMNDEERRLEEFFKVKDQIAGPTPAIELPPYCVKVEDYLPTHVYRQEAESHLAPRKLPVDGLYYCHDGEFRNRIIIPYFDKVGRLIYWNARHIIDKHKLRYMGPAKEVGVGKADVIYMVEWPEPGSRIYLTEGEFDAISLTLAGFFAGACGGKELSDSQIEYLRGYEVCLALDNDKAGKRALPVMAGKLTANGFPWPTWVRPPKDFKDWNKLLQVHNEKVLRGYVVKSERMYSEDMLWEDL